MNNMTQAVASLCTFAVIYGLVQFLLPQDGIGEYVRIGGRILLVALAANILISIPHISLSSTSGVANEAITDPEHYVSERLADNACQPIEDEVRKTLSQFGINRGQIRIEFDKGSYGDISLSHISVGIPKSYEGDRMALKRLLLNKFEVYCDVYLLEDAEDET